jgi:glycosyltransferase involved in cell wall biosynthesis
VQILFLSQLVPYPADAGPKIRIYHVLQYLAEAGHQVTLAAFHRPDDRPEQIEHLRRFCREVHTVLMPRSKAADLGQLVRSLLSGRPFLIARDDIPAMHRLLETLLTNNTYDAVHADQLWMAQYALAARKAGEAKQPPVRLRTVLDQHNAVYLVPQRMAATTSNPASRLLLRLEERKLAAYEVKVCQDFDQVVWVTDEDREALAQVGGQNKGKTIPICVDPEATLPVSRRPEARRVTFLGGMHWPPNSQGILWFAQAVWPRVLAVVPEAVLTIMGKNPPSALQGIVSGSQSIEVLGYVADPASYLAETATVIVPLHAGGGMRVKILDAWGWGVPLVSTSIGAEGICYEDGRNLVIADGAEEFAESVIRLLKEPEWAKRVGQNGRQTVETHYNWHTIYRAWDTIYERQPV